MPFNMSVLQKEKNVNISPAHGKNGMKSSQHGAIGGANDWKQSHLLEHVQLVTG